MGFYWALQRLFSPLCCISSVRAFYGGDFVQNKVKAAKKAIKVTAMFLTISLIISSTAILSWAESDQMTASLTVHIRIYLLDGPETYNLVINNEIVASEFNINIWPDFISFRDIEVPAGVKLTIWVETSSGIVSSVENITMEYTEINNISLEIGNYSRVTFDVIVPTTPYIPEAELYIDGEIYETEIKILPRPKIVRTGSIYLEIDKEYDIEMNYGDFTVSKTVFIDKHEPGIIDLN